MQLAGEGLELLPGVLPLLEALAARDDVAVGLVTGNLEPIGWGALQEERGGAQMHLVGSRSVCMICTAMSFLCPPALCSLPTRLPSPFPLGCPCPRSQNGCAGHPPPVHADRPATRQLWWLQHRHALLSSCLACLMLRLLVDGWDGHECCCDAAAQSLHELFTLPLPLCLDLSPITCRLLQPSQRGGELAGQG